MKFALILFSLITTIAVSAAEIKFPRQPVPRSNTIKIGDVTLNIDRASTSKFNWQVTAKRGGDIRQAIINRNGINLICYPDLVLELRNWNIPRGESWNILAETVGDYQIRTLKPSELLPGSSKVKFAQKRVKGRTHHIFRNGLLSMECIPSINGAVVSMYDEITKREFLRNIAKNGDLNLKSFQNIGFVELFDIWGKTPQVAMDWNVKNGLIRMQGKSQMRTNAVLTREMRLRPDSFVFELKSAVKYTGAGTPTLIELKHRPEFNMFKVGSERSFNVLLPDANDRLKYTTPQSGTASETNRSAYAIVDSAAGLLMGVRYQDARLLYLWCDRNYFAAEAMAPKVMISKNPQMSLTYFFIHGMSRADFLGKNVALALPEKPMMVLEGTAASYPVDCVFGTAVPLKMTAIIMSLIDQNGKVRSTRKTSFTPPATGFATEFTAAVNVKNVPAGKYSLNIRVISFGEEVLNRSLSFRITAKSETEMIKRCLARVNSRIAAARKEFRTTKNKQKVMKEFRRYIQLREKLLALQKSGDPASDDLRKDPLFKGIF